MPIRLDSRLSLLANLSEGRRVADIGCDHGKLSYYLIGTDRADLVIATDISAPSLQKAKDLAHENGVEDVLVTRLGDGLKPIQSREVDTVIIAGMGGDVIQAILKGAREDGKCFAHFLISSNTHPEKVRREILKYKHTIVFDDIIECGSKQYTVIKTVEGESTLDDMQIQYGAFYKTNKNFYIKIKKDIEALQTILDSNKEAYELIDKINALKEIAKSIDANKQGDYEN